MNTQPKALQIADELLESKSTYFERKAAAELRRLQLLNAELLEALQQMQLALSRCFGPHKAEEGDRHRALAASRAAITKAQE
jgi:hypothetical protein